jgi:glycosyltransferase 2 family protein
MKKWQIWLGLLISVVFIVVAFRGLDFREILISIQSAEIIWILPAIPVYFLGLWFRAYRWKIFLKPISDLQTHQLFPVVAIGYMGNNIYPARLGELVRSAILKKDENIPVSASLATIIIERIFDGIVMLGFIILNLSVVSLMTHSIEIKQTVDSVATWGTSIFLFAFLIFMLSAFFPIASAGLINKITAKILPQKYSQPINTIVEKFFSGIRALSSPIQTIYALMVTIVIWLIETLFYWIIMQAFPFDVSFGTLMLLSGFLNLFTIIPSSPGYIGTFDAPGIALLTALGIESQNAAGYTLLLHAALWLPVTVLGAIFFLQKGISWNDAISQSKKDQ